MKYNIKLISLVTVLCFFFACSTSKKIPLTQQNRQSIETVKLIVVVKQDNIFAQIDSTAGDAVGYVGIQYGAIGGLLGGLIAASINEMERAKTEKLIAPIKQTLLQVNFGSDLTVQLKKKLSEIEWISVKEAENRRSLDDEERDKVLNEMKEKSLLVVRASYYLSATFNLFMVESTAELYTKDEEKDCLFRSKVMCFSDSLDLNDKSASVAEWSKNDGTKIKSAITEAVEETASMLHYELRMDEDPKVIDRNPTIVAYSGEKRQFVRHPDGKLISTIKPVRMSNPTN
jgi:hypothetical protein